MDKPLTHNQLKGAQFEGDHWPKRPSREGVASHVGVSKTAITKWRRDPRYKAAIAARRDQRTVEQIDAAVEKEMAQILDEAKAVWQRQTGLPAPPSKSAPAANMHVYVKNNWPGPTKCIVCGKTFFDPTSYVEHLVTDHPGHDIIVG
jgi:hypothetical protein